ncbi:VOC family protein [Enterococcus sp. AZ163]|uniref:VOC family protein n=1 Tax=Enterococcus sp. AZ163 TaxID=2774638 RepID=UPI003D2821EA
MYQQLTANLMVDSIEETLSFYQEKLGFTLVASVPNEKGYLQFAIVEKDGLHLMFQERRNMIEEYPMLEASATKPGITLFIKVTDFDQLYQSLKSNVSLAADLHETFYGTKEFAILDNSGYVLTFAEN